MEAESQQLDLARADLPDRAKRDLLAGGIGRDMTTISHTTTFELAVSIDKLFPLFSPEGEKLWVPGWDYKNVMGTTELSEDYVFLTRSHDHAETDAVWVVKKYVPLDRLVEFYRIEPEQKVGLIRVSCSPVSAQQTAVEVTYRYTALSDEGERFIANFDEKAYGDFIAEWKTLLSRYFCIAGDA